MMPVTHQLGPTRFCVNRINHRRFPLTFDYCYVNITNVESRRIVRGQVAGKGGRTGPNMDFGRFARGENNAGKRAYEQSR